MSTHHETKKAPIRATNAPKPLANRRLVETIGGTWRIDPRRSCIEFRVRVFWGLGSVSGRFDAYEGQLDLGAKPAIELTIEADSVQTGNRRRDRHLRSADFFDAEHHPQIRFLSDSVDLQAGMLKVRGRLSARGQSVPLEVIAPVRWADGELEIEAVAIAAHRKLGLTWSPFRIIPPRTEARVKACLIPVVRTA
jgi:polyisoprenoid-binding protein YceI